MDNKTVFVIVNAPKDETFLVDFIEATLDAEVNYLEYSSAFEGTVLVSVDSDAGVELISKLMKKEEEDLEGRLGPIRILDPGFRDDSVTVTNLDETFLCRLFLQLYIESTFADGQSVVCDCQWIPQYDKTVVVTFKDRNVIASVLKEYDHIPMASIQDYHIQFKPYYSTFYSATKIDRVEEDETCSGAPGSNVTGESIEEKERPVNLKGPFEDAVEEKNISEEEEETINIAKLEWQLLKVRCEYEKYKTDLPTEDCQMDYDETAEVLHIRGKNVADSKQKIDQLLRNMTKSYIQLTEDMSKVIFRDDVKEKLTVELVEIKNIAFELVKNSIIVHCFPDEGVEEIIDDIKKRYLSVNSIEMPPADTSSIKDLLQYIKDTYIAVGSCDLTKLTITGLEEDVVLASSDMKKELNNIKRIDQEFSLKDKDAAIFVTRFALDTFRKLFHKKATITNEVTDGGVIISFKYNVKQVDKWDLLTNLENYVKDIKKTTIDQRMFQKEDKALIIGYLSTDTDLIERFERTNSCCICVKDKNMNDIFSTAPKVRKAKQDSDTQDQKVRSGSLNSFTFNTSCQLKISKRGNVIQEPSELLVCGVHKSLKLGKTAVSKDFLKEDNSLGEDIKTFTFSPAGVCVAQRPLPNTTCKAIAFITLDTWQAGVSDQRLGAAVNEVLEQANKLNIRTISFPPLGVGRAFKFPADQTAQAIVKAIDNYQTANAGVIRIKCINLMAQDPQLYSGLCKAAGCISTFIPSAGGDDDNEQNSSNVQGDFLATDTDIEYEMETSLPKQLPSVTIVSNNSKDDISKIFIEEIKKEWLFEEYFEPREPFCWPPQFMMKVIEKAKALKVWVCRLNDPLTKQPIGKIKIKGKTNDVRQMKNDINDIFMRFKSESPRKILFSSNTPQRGTMEFIKHASSCDAQFPTYWKLKRKDDQNNSTGQTQTYNLVDVDKKTETDVIEVVEKTWDSRKTGRGYDAANIPHNSQVKVVQVQRLENPTLFMKYSTKRKFILEEIVRGGRVCQPVDKLDNSTGPALTMESISSFLKKELIHEINEYYMFHGTKEAIVKSISDQGMDNRLSSAGAMFGQGVYTAEMSVKADQYADDRDNRLPQGTNLHMFLTRVTLGDIFLCDHNHKSVKDRDSQKLKRPPCSSCGEDICTCYKTHYHSVMGDGKWIFREFVVYEKDQCYPEYLITYKRV